eukprot:CAMPEP_0118665964 /NCGR_PEP_ID=MMETSP0785-20121206/18937_1 /TAXON_ID=91992 /ORGANISM="Bolidomonas pacifica, Strain CCMP 1866" /LENGTH=96 /DNA_ID=CAMNT_0006560193 /DNA_START=187 /DNA_END=473 /DNA_ORIENTATION=+
MTDDGEGAVGEDLGDPSITSGPLTQGGCVIHKELPKSMGDGDLTDFYIATHKHCSVKKGDELDSDEYLLTPLSSQSNMVPISGLVETLVHTNLLSP